MLAKKRMQREIDSDRLDRVVDAMGEQNIRQDRFSSSYLELAEPIKEIHTTPDYLTIYTLNNYVIQFSLGQQRVLWKVQLDLDQTYYYEVFVKTMQDGQVFIQTAVGGGEPMQLFIIKDGHLICQQSYEENCVYNFESIGNDYSLFGYNGAPYLKFFSIREGVLTELPDAHYTFGGNWKNIRVNPDSGNHLLFHNGVSAPVLVLKTMDGFKVISEITSLQHVDVIQAVLTDSLLCCAYKSGENDHITILIWDINNNERRHEFSIEHTRIHGMWASDQYLVYSTLTQGNRRSVTGDIYAFDLGKMRVFLAKSSSNDIKDAYIQASINKNIFSLSYPSSDFGDDTEKVKRVIIALRARQQLYEVNYRGSCFGDNNTNYFFSSVTKYRESIHTESWGAFNESHLPNAQKGLMRV